MSAATRLFGAGVDEQLIMARTGHSSVSGVHTYKRKVEKLQEITSDVLNTSTVSTPADVHSTERAESSLDCSRKLKQLREECSKNLPGITVSGGSNVTVNINLS